MYQKTLSVRIPPFPHANASGLRCLINNKDDDDYDDDDNMNTCHIECKFGINKNYNRIEKTK